MTLPVAVSVVIEAGVKCGFVCIWVEGFDLAACGGESWGDEDRQGRREEGEEDGERGGGEIHVEVCSRYLKSMNA